jgi:signal transduction histidine kinase
LAVLWVLAALPVLWAAAAGGPAPLTPVEVVVHVAVLGVALLLTRRSPALALAVAIAAWEVVYLSRAETDGLLAASALAAGLAAVALLAGRSPASSHRDAVVLVVGPAAGAVAALVGVGEVDTTIGAAVGAAVLATVPWALGRYRRQYAAMVSAGWDRAARWEREAEYARARERARLAGEMHDLVGHELAKVALQIGALEVDGGLDPRHRAAAGAARAGVTAAAERLADTVRMLRADDAGTGASVPELVERSAAAGLDVTLDAAALPAHDPVVDATLGRITAEALTNAMKHSPGAPVRVTLADGERGPVLTVRNGPALHGGRSTGAGLGLAGLGERVRLLGGTFEAGPEPGGGFAVTAALPRRPSAPVSAGPSAADAERRSAQQRLRRTGARAVLAAALVSVTGVAIVLAYMWFDAATSVLSPADAARISTGMPMEAVAPLLPARTRTDDPGGVPPEPPGSTCRYYSTQPDPFTAGGDELQRLCFRAGRVVGVDVVRRAPFEEAG